MKPEKITITWSPCVSKSLLSRWTTPPDHIDGKGTFGTLLHLALTHHWYDQTESGEKCVEYRAMTERWRKLIWDRKGEIVAVRFSRGYSRRTLTRLVHHIDIGPCPIPGWDGNFYRIHFINFTKPNGKDQT